MKAHKLELVSVRGCKQQFEIFAKILLHIIVAASKTDMALAICTVCTLDLTSSESM